MVGGDRRSPPRHRAKGGGGKAKGSGNNDELNSGGDDSRKSDFTKLGTREEVFRFGDGAAPFTSVDGKSTARFGTQEVEEIANLHNDSNGLYVNLGETTPVQCFLQKTDDKRSWALEVEAQDEIQRVMNSNLGVEACESIEREMESSDSQQAVYSDAIDGNISSQATGMDCDGLIPTPAVFSHEAVCNSLDYVSHNVDGCMIEKSGKNGCADNTVLQRTNSCTQGVCLVASTGQNAENTENAYVKTGLMGVGKSAISSFSTSDGKESNLNVQHTQGQHAVNRYVKTGFMVEGNSAVCGIAASNGQETALNMQNSQGKKIWNFPMMSPRAECAKQVGDYGLKQKTTAGSTLPNAHMSNAWKRTSHLRVNTMELGTITKNGRAVSFDEAAYERNRGRLENGLVGKLFGRKLPLHILDQELSRRWSHVGGFRTILIGGDCFLCVFESMEARDSILMGGPWQIMGQLIGMEKWSPECNPELLTGFSSPVWVRFPKLPLLYWDNITIARIASMIGEPLWIDAQTIEWGRCEYARVCIRIDLSKSLPTGVWIQGKQAEFFQAVEYEGISLLCFHCGVIGHKAEGCQNKGMVTSTQNAASIKKTNVGANGGAMDGSNPSSALGDCSSTDRLKVHYTDRSIQQEPDSHDSAIYVDQEDVKKYGPWILVSRKRKSQPKNGKKFAPNMMRKPVTPQTTHQPEVILESQQEKVPVLDEQPDSHVHDSEAPLSAQQMDVAAVEPVKTNDASFASSSRKGKSRISKAHFEKELLQLGPIALKSRKRKKKVSATSLKDSLKGHSNQDDTDVSLYDGGDASPSCGE